MSKSNDTTIGVDVNNISKQLTSEDTPSEAIELFDISNERIIAVKPIYVAICGSVTAAYVLTQLLWLGEYFKEEFDRNEFFKTNDELCNDLGEGGLLIDAFKAAKRRLVHLKFITVVPRGTPQKSHYIIQKQTIINAMIAFRRTHPNPKLSKPSNRGLFHQLIGAKSTNLSGPNPPTNTKRTSERTSKKDNNVEQVRPIDCPIKIAQAVELQDHWADKLGHPRFKASFETKIGKKRFDTSMDVIAEFGLEDAKKIITGFAKAPPSMEKKGQTVIYDSLDLIFRYPFRIPGYRKLAETEDGNKSKLVTPPKERL